MKVLTLTDTPDHIAEVLKQHDLRTMMLPLNPMVLIRYGLRDRPTADPTPVPPAKRTE